MITTVGMGVKYLCTIPCRFETEKPIVWIALKEKESAPFQFDIHFMTRPITAKMQTIELIMGLSLSYIEDKTLIVQGIISTRNQVLVSM